MINSVTGDISIRNADIVISPSLTRAAFLASSIGQCSQVSVNNEPHCSFNASVAANDLMTMPADLTLSFYDEHLEAVSISASDDRFGTSWDDWSEEKELDRKHAHDQWLEDFVGTANRYQPWGQLSSGYDERAGFSSIVLRYSWLGKPWRPSATAK